MTTAELRALIARCDDWSAEAGVTRVAIPTRDLAALVRLTLAARDLRRCGIEHDDPRVGYVLAQLDRQDLAAFDAALTAVFGGDDE